MMNSACTNACLPHDGSKRNGVRALDIAKRLMDFGYHPPTIYFPLLVPEALMIEPTETESRQTLDDFIDAMQQIARDVEDDPEIVKSAPHITIVRKLDEATAARQPSMWTPPRGPTDSRVRCRAYGAKNEHPCGQERTWRPMQRCLMKS